MRTLAFTKIDIVILKREGWIDYIKNHESLISSVIFSATVRMPFLPCKQERNG